MRSAPTSLGLSTSSGIPVRTPGSISTCGTDGQYCSKHLADSCSTDGTVDRPAAPVRPFGVVADQAVDGQRQFVGGDLGFGANPPVLHDLRVVSRTRYQPDDGVGVADVDR